MNRDDIIRTAREAGLAHFYDSEGHCSGLTDAKLVDADKERDDDRLLEMLEPFTKLVAEEEREAIATLVEQMGIEGYGTLAIAVVIRRGERR